jgi:frataxin-like iron-binding protein CyaY
MQIWWASMHLGFGFRVAVAERVSTRSDELIELAFF